MLTRALVLAGGSGPSRAELDAVWPDWADGLELVIAADAGALLAGLLGVHLDLIVGDADSLGEPGLAGRAVALLDGRTRVRLLDGVQTGPARLGLTRRPGALVTLLAFDGPAGGVTTGGLRWPLAGATLGTGSSRGLSNEVVGPNSPNAWVELLAGRLLVIETILLGSAP